MARRTRMHRLDISPLARLLVSLAVGAVVAATFTYRSWIGAALAGWAATCVVLVVLTWAAVGHMDAATTQAHSTREEPTRAGAHLVVLVGAIASLAGVVALLAGTGTHRVFVTITVLASVTGSWAAVQTVFALRYARIFYTDPVGGIDFHQTANPEYTDFAYVAVTVGATFAIADTDLGSSAMRRTALWHSLLSYGLGAVVIGLTVNVVAGLSPG